MKNRKVENQKSKVKISLMQKMMNQGKKINIFFEIKSAGCKGVFKFYLSLVLILLVGFLIAYMIAFLGKDIFPGDHTLYMVTGAFMISSSVFFLTPCEEKYKSSREKYNTYKKAKRYIHFSYKLVALEILIRLIFSAESFGPELYSLVGFLAIMMAFWFTFSTLFVFFANHKIVSSHKLCYEKMLKPKRHRKPDKSV